MAAKQAKEVNTVVVEQGADRAQLPWNLIIAVTVVVVLLAFVVGFELIYYQRALPGVTADGVYVGGLSKAETTAAIAKQTTAYQKEAIPLQYGTTTVSVPVTTLGVNYNSVQAADLALNFGHTGSLLTQLHAQLRALFGKPTALAQYTYSDAQLASFVGPAVDAETAPVSNAGLTATGNAETVTPATDGARVDIGLLALQLTQRLATTTNDKVVVATYDLPPAVDTAGLEAAKSQAATYMSAPLTLTYAGHTKTVPVATIASWLTVSGQMAASIGLPTYATVGPQVKVGLNQGAIAAYVSNLASSVDSSPVNATITMTNGQPTAASTGSNGQKLDQTGSVAAIVAALDKPAADRTLALNVATVAPAVTSDSLASLGIKDLLSEGETTFYGSNADRNTNIRVGANQFNDVLVAPGQTFSFDTALGPIGPQYGYAPGYVILGNSEELQYGGGLCQVATTMYRAALLAGLPIVSRSNHSYAVSWYVAPYGVPGVDATIYPPDPDLKWTNDTGSYILMETTMTNTSLKFDFYGTKTKTGVIRGPYFVTGSNDATKASHTVFYRDILDLSGNVIHTDTVNSYYAPSTDFPIVD
jgi:vancomycin resistance protein YoaR